MRSALNSSAWALMAVIALGVAAAIYVWPKFEDTPPTIRGPDELVVGADGGTLTVEIEDWESGLRTAEVRLVQAEGETPLQSFGFGGSLLAGGDPTTSPATLEVAIDPKALRLADGRASVVVVVRDWSLRDNGEGNRAEASFPLVIDTEAPTISAAPGITYIYRGGSGSVVYSLSEETARDGIRVADSFYAGHPLPGAADGSLERIALFAVPVDAPADPPVSIEAEDAAGNVASAKLRARVFERKFATERLDLSSRFFENVIPDLAASVGVDEPDLVEAFQIINRDTREANEARIRELTRETADVPLWEGPFAQLANSKVMSRFAEKRIYFTEGREISRATHLGFDLASRSEAPITAANAGRVVYAGDLGIYGNCVLIDHGLGLTSLYGHLSSIEVSAGDPVEKGDVLGHSGATGLAGGDHLHYGMLVSGSYVDPLEWWDPRWVQSHVDVRLSPSRP